MLPVLSLVLFSGCTTEASTPAAAPPSVEVRLSLAGALDGQVSLVHARDSDNGCRIGGAPAAHQTTATGVVETPDGPPKYRLSASDHASQFALSVMPYRQGQQRFDDASNAGVWLTTPDGSWTLPTQPEPGVSITVSFADDGGSGAFQATGLVAMRNGAPDRSLKRLDVAGEWRCQTDGR